MTVERGEGSFSFSYYFYLQTLCFVQKEFAGTRQSMSEHWAKQLNLWPHPSVTYQDVLVLVWAHMHSQHHARTSHMVLWHCQSVCSQVGGFQSCCVYLVYNDLPTPDTTTALLCIMMLTSLGILTLDQAWRSLSLQPTAWSYNLAQSCRCSGISWKSPQPRVTSYSSVFFTRQT